MGKFSIFVFPCEPYCGQSVLWIAFINHSVYLSKYICIIFNFDEKFSILTMTDFFLITHLQFLMIQLHFLIRIYYYLKITLPITNNFIEKTIKGKDLFQDMLYLFYFVHELMIIKSSTNFIWPSPIMLVFLDTSKK